MILVQLDFSRDRMLKWDKTPLCLPHREHHINWWRWTDELMLLFDILNDRFGQEPHELQHLSLHICIPLNHYASDVLNHPTFISSSLPLLEHPSK